jgi:hypothetical protein
MIRTDQIARPPLPEACRRAGVAFCQRRHHLGGGDKRRPGVVSVCRPPASVLSTLSPRVLYREWSRF